MSMIVWENSFFALVSIKNFQNLIFCTVSSRKFPLANFQTIMVKIFETFIKKTPKLQRYLFRFFLENSTITCPIKTKLYRRIASDKKLQILLKKKYHLLSTWKKALKLCWHHQIFQISSTTQQTPVPSTHPKIQSPKSTGQSTWSSHLRASHLRALFYTLLS